LALVTDSAAASPAFCADFDPLALAAFEAETEADDAAEEMLERRELPDLEATEDAEDALFGATLVADLPDLEPVLAADVADLYPALVAEVADLDADEAPRPI
jgi:hypothetical protein